VNSYNDFNDLNKCKDLLDNAIKVINANKVGEETIYNAKASRDNVKFDALVSVPARFR